MILEAAVTLGPTVGAGPGIKDSCNRFQANPAQSQALRLTPVIQGLANGSKIS